ncbi:MAG TPA: efflux RND transporter periplasmic adaptor subunit [Polyangiaceae bacterium]
MATHATNVTALHSAAPQPSSGTRRKRYVAIGVVLLVVVLLVVGIKATQIRMLLAAGKKMQQMGPPPETVSTSVAAQQTWDETLASVGTIAAARGVTISNDSPGIVSKIAFESGDTVQQGKALVELDTSVERAQLASARARRELAQANLGRTKHLVESGSLAKAQLDTDQAALNGAVSDADALEAQIERKTVRAPCAGKLGIRLVNLGQYLGPGTPVTVLDSQESRFVDFDLPQEDLTLIAVGMPVRLRLERADAGAGAPAAEGKVFAIDPQVDPNTRNVKVRATVPASDARFQPGMFVDVAVVEPKQATVVAVSGTAVVHASYGDSVFIVEDDPSAPGGHGKKVRQQFVRVGAVRGDFVAIEDGVQAGQEVVSEGAFKLRNNARIAINDTDVKLVPELAPHPPNR